MSLATRTKVKPPANLSVTYSVVSQGVFVAKLGWTPIESGQPRSYNVIYREGDEIGSTLSAVTYRDTSILEGVSYNYSVSTVNVNEVEGDPCVEVGLAVPAYPVWTTGWSLSIQQNQTDSVATRCSDPAGASLTFSKQGGTAPAGVTVNSAGTVAVGSTTAGGYTLGIRASNGQLTSDTTVNLTVNAVVVAPDPPINAFATAISGTEAQLDWERAPTNPIPNDYDLRYATTSGGSTTTIAHTGTVTTKSVTGLSPGNYYFEVRAGIDANESAWVSFSPSPLTLIDESEQPADFVIPAGSSGALANLTFDGNSTTHPNVQGPSRAVQAGDIIELEAGTHGRRNFIDVIGSSGNRITIRNGSSGQVIIRSPTAMSGGFANVFKNCRYVNVLGDNSSSAPAHPTVAGERIGIKWMYASSGTDGATALVKLQALNSTTKTTDNITFSNVEFDGGWAVSGASKNVGIGFATNDSTAQRSTNPGAFQQNVKLLNFVAHGFRSDAIYFGPNFSSGVIPLENCEVGFGYVYMVGGTGVTCKGWWQGVNSAHDLLIEDCALIVEGDTLYEGLSYSSSQVTFYNIISRNNGTTAAGHLAANGRGISGTVNNGPLTGVSPGPGYPSYSQFVVTLYNCVTYGSLISDGIAVGKRDGANRVPTLCRIYNCTSEGNGDTGIENDGVVSGSFIRNCISVNNGGGQVSVSGGTSQSSNTTTGTPASLFVNHNAGNYRLNSEITASGTIGTDISSTDLDGTSRTGTASRGAYEFA